MKKDKILLVSFIFMIAYFLIQILVESSEVGFNFTSDFYKRKIVGSIIMGVLVGIAIKLKWIKTNNILSE